MPQQTRKEKSLNSYATFRVTREMLEMLDEIAAREARTRSFVAIALVERGLAEYRKDRRLLGPWSSALRGVDGNPDRDEENGSD